MLRRSAIRELVESHGVRGYLKIQARLIGLNENGSVPRGADGKRKLHESVQLPNGRSVPRISPREFSFRGLWEGLVGPVEETLNYARDAVGLVEMPAHLEEAVSSGAFPSATGQLIATEVIEGYEDTSGFIGDSLVQTMPSQLRGESVVGFTAAQGPKEVVEGQQYKDSSIAEKTVGTRETKRGRLISVTEEAVFFDQTGQVLDRARNIGYAARQDRERRIVQGVIDHDSGEAVYAPGGTAEQLYAAGNNNLATSIGALQDWTDIQEVLNYHANNVTDDRQADDTDGPQPIVWMPRILLTSLELAGRAQRIVNATLLTDQNTEGRNLPMAANLTPLSSPFINAATAGDRWDDNSDWLVGDFQRQFRYKEIWPLQTFRAPAQNDDQFERDIVARFKVREYGDIFALDERWVVKVDVA